MGTKGDRDAAMDRVLSAALRGRAGTPGTPPQAGSQADARAGECPPAEDIAAMVEGSLGALERRTLEAHLAECERCQDVLAVFADLPAPIPERTTSRPRARRTARFRWMIPATAAGALVLYLAVGPRWAAKPPTNQMARSEVQKAPALEERLQPRGGEGAKAATPQPEAPAAEPVASNASPTLEKGGQAAPRTSPTAAHARPAAVAPSEIVSKAAATPPRDEAVDLLKDGKAAPTPAKTRLADAASKGATAAAPPAAPVQAMAGGVAGQAAAEPGPRGAQAGRLTVAPAPAAGVSVERRMGLVAESVSVPAQRVVGFSSPDGRVRWRLQGGGAIFRSTDAGATWQQQQSGVQEDLVAGSAPLATTCWAVGRNGTVLRSVDGEHWDRRAFPETVDLVGVQATDGQSAVVTARDGRRFATADGGITWIIAR